MSTKIKAEAPAEVGPTYSIWFVCQPVGVKEQWRSVEIQRQAINGTLDVSWPADIMALHDKQCTASSHRLGHDAATNWLP